MPSGCHLQKNGQPDGHPHPVHIWKKMYTRWACHLVVICKKKWQLD